MDSEARCPFCDAAWTVAKRHHDCPAAMIVYLSARCPRCQARVDAAGHAVDAAEAERLAFEDLTHRCHQRRGTQPADWRIPVREARGLTRRRGP